MLRFRYSAVPAADFGRHEPGPGLASSARNAQHLRRNKLGYLTLLLVLPALDAAMIVAIPGDQTTLIRSAAISASAATLILA